MHAARALSLLVILSIGGSASHGAAADGAPPSLKPLSEAASGFAKQLPAGVIVTAEAKAGAPVYAIVGKSELTGVPPEKLIFEIGSISKVFTGVLFAEAVHEGKVKPGTTVQEILGADFKFSDPRVGAITLKQLATHTSGLPRLPDNLDENAHPDDPYAAYDRAKLESYLRGAKLVGAGPYPMSYSNLGMGLLGELLSRAYGKPWAALITEKVSSPLGLKDTSVALDAEQKKRFLPAFAVRRPVKPWDLNVLVAAGGLHSTAADLVRFGEAQAHPEKTPLKEALELALQPHTDSGDIGFGIMLSDVDGQKVYEHQGATGGYHSALEVSPAQDVVRVILTNNAAIEPRAIFNGMRSETPRTKESGRVVSQDELNECVGVYPISAEARFTVIQHEGHLFARLTGQTFLELLPHEDKDRFFYKKVAADIVFQRTNGKISGLHLLQNGRVVKATRTADAAPQVRFRPAKELAAFAGKYEISPAMILTVIAGDNALLAQLSGQPFAPVFETRDDWFDYEVVKAALEFKRNKDGKVTAVQLHQNGMTLMGVKK